MKKLWLLCSLLAVNIFAEESTEYSLEGDQQKEFHQELNGYTHIQLGGLTLDEDIATTLVVGFGQWIDGANYGYGANIQFMPTGANIVEGSQNVDYNSLSIFGKWIFLSTGIMELHLNHALGAGLLKIISDSSGSASQREEGFGFVDIGLGLDVPLSRTLELTINGDWRQSFLLDESTGLDSQDLSSPMVHVGIRWYPNAVSEVK